MGRRRSGHRSGGYQPLVGAFHEARPYTTLPGILVLVQRSADFSFPSDHAVMAGGAAAGLWLCTRSLAAVATAAALLMALARVYMAAHYPHDVAAGLLFGALVALLGWWVLRRPLTVAATRLEGTSCGRWYRLGMARRCRPRRRKPPFPTGGGDRCQNPEGDH
jgi:membrane-associated phospholipid phosphatase